jgi:hypothetical protein
MTSSSHDAEQLSFDFSEKRGGEEVRASESKSTASIHIFRDALSIKVRQQAVQRVTASGIFSIEELKEG